MATQQELIDLILEFLHAKKLTETAAMLEAELKKEKLGNRLDGPRSQLEVLLANASQNQGVKKSGLSPMARPQLKILNVLGGSANSSPSSASSGSTSSPIALSVGPHGHSRLEVVPEEDDLSNSPSPHSVLNSLAATLNMNSTTAPPAVQPPTTTPATSSSIQVPTLKNPRVNVTNLADDESETSIPSVPVRKNFTKLSSSYAGPSTIMSRLTDDQRAKRVFTSTGHHRPTGEMFPYPARVGFRKRTSSRSEEARLSPSVLHLPPCDELPQVDTPISSSLTSSGTAISRDPSYSSSDEYSDDEDIGYCRISLDEYCKWKPELRDQMCVLFSDDDSDYSDDESSSYGRKRNSKHSTRQSATVSDSDDEIAAQIANYNKSDATAPKDKFEVFEMEMEGHASTAPSAPDGPFVLSQIHKSANADQQASTATSSTEFSEVNIVPDPSGAPLEYFNLKVVYVKNKTGFEPTHDFPIKVGDVIAGRYEIKRYLGSAAFSRAVQCYDHKTKNTVCVKIIKNNKDYFDQSLDEIKLLTLIKSASDCDTHHVLRMFDYFYFKEHLFIVCELLQENLYEVYKYNRQSGEELYFTVPRLQKVAKQCLIALQFIHSLNLMHCDLKPENILIKSYSRCEIKVIDFGSSCFTTDQLSSYVQSRSYRAPEVILGHAYDQRIDLWSLGCILAELWTGKVLFQNESLPTLLAKQIGILGLNRADKEWIRSAPLAGEYFTDQGILYEKREEGVVEYIYPKKSSLRKRLNCDDALFVDFVSTLLTLNPNNRPTAAQALEHPWLKQEYPAF